MSGPHNIPAPGEQDPGGEFVVQKAMPIGGVKYAPGELLRADSILRSMPHKINILCRSRALRPVPKEATPPPPEAPATTSHKVKKSKHKPSVSELKAMSRAKLVKLAKKRGVAYEGTDKSIRIRIRKSYN